MVLAVGCLAASLGGTAGGEVLQDESVGHCCLLAMARICSLFRDVEQRIRVVYMCVFDEMEMI